MATQKYSALHKYKKVLFWKKNQSQELCNKSQVYFMPYLHTYQPHSILEFILKISFSFSNCTWLFSNCALFLIDIVSVPYKKGLLPHVCTVTCKAMNIW